MYDIKFLCVKLIKSALTQIKIRYLYGAKTYIPLYIIVIGFFVVKLEFL